MSYSVYIKDGSTLVPLPSGGGVSVTAETKVLSKAEGGDYLDPDVSADTPVMIFYNGLLLHPGVDYELSDAGATFLFIVAPGDVITKYVFEE